MTSEEQIVVACPECGQRGVVRDVADKGGKLSIKCSNCGARFSHLLDRRTYRRKVPYPSIRFGPFDFDFKNLLQRGELMDISINGMRLRTQTHNPPRESERLSVTFMLPGTSTALKVGAEVVWVHHAADGWHELGTHFFHLTEHDRRSIGFYLMP